jgi:hypothetical protein
MLGGRGRAWPGADTTAKLGASVDNEPSNRAGHGRLRPLQQERPLIAQAVRACPSRRSRQVRSLVKLNC